MGIGYWLLAIGCVVGGGWFAVALCMVFARADRATEEALGTGRETSRQREGKEG